MQRLRLVLTVILTYLKIFICSRYIELFMNGLPTRLFPNVSLGLDHNLESFGHQCMNDGTRRFPEFATSGRMGYTMNRRVQSATLEAAQDESIQLAFILALGGHNNFIYDYGPGGSLNGIMSVWDSWVANFFSRTSNTSSLVLLFDERDFLNQNETKSVDDYIDMILIKNMGASPVDCVQDHRGNNKHVQLRHSTRRHHGTHSAIRKPPHGCNNRLVLDQGYLVYYIDVATPTNPDQLPFVIFAGIHRFPVPEWARGQNEDTLFIHWRPSRLGRFKTNYGYVKMTNWYSYHMLNLQILDFFDYGGKLDNDVSFTAPFPEPNLPLRMVRSGSKMIVSEAEWYCDDWRIAQGNRLCLNDWMTKEKARCGGKHVPMIPGAQNTVLLEGNLNLTIRSHFITYWLGIYDAPETKALAEFWNGFHPRGMWDYRWGDQQWWTRPIAMFGDGNVSRDIDKFWELNSTDNGKFVRHKLWPMVLTIDKTVYFNSTGSTAMVRRENYLTTVKKLCKTTKWVECPR